MFSLNRIGQNMPPCNNRQFSTMGIVKNHPEDMKLKPEYLGNEHFKFLNNFGLPQQIISNKKFVDINSFNRHHIDSRVPPNSCIMRNFASTIVTNHPTPKNLSCDRSIYKPKNENAKVAHNFEKPNSIINNFNTIEDTIKPSMVTSKHEKVNACDNSTRRHEESKSCEKLYKKPKRNKAQRQCDKTNQNSSKKPKKQKNFQKKSKRESDRSACSTTSPHNRRNSKPWHKKSLKMEIMEFDDAFNCAYSNHNLESPVITQLSAISLPDAEPACFQHKLGTTSSPAKIVQETQTENAKRTNDIQICNSPKQSCFRPRLPSDCESEDSFIVFEEGSKCIDVEASDCAQDSTDYGSSSDEDSSDDSDNVDFCSTFQRFADCIVSPYKKVRFAMGKDLCEVHPMVQWSFAYQRARKGPWEQFALDRMRFRNRVSRVEPTLSAVLQPAHRSRIYEERFQHNEN